MEEVLRQGQSLFLAVGADRDRARAPADSLDRSRARRCRVLPHLLFEARLS